MDATFAAQDQGLKVLLAGLEYEAWLCKREIEGRLGKELKYYDCSSGDALGHGRHLADQWPAGANRRLRIIVPTASGKSCPQSAITPPPFSRLSLPFRALLDAG